jgi:hypothetical protein
MLLPVFKILHLTERRKYLQIYTRSGNFSENRIPAIVDYPEKSGCAEYSGLNQVTYVDMKPTSRDMARLLIYMNVKKQFDCGKKGVSIDIDGLREVLLYLCLGHQPIQFSLPQLVHLTCKATSFFA